MKSKLLQYCVHAAFLISLVATCGSLFLSEVLHWTPCPLCWFQRILMYPQTILFFVALIKNDKKIYRYAIPLSSIGILISTYHILIQFIPKLDLQRITLCNVSGTPCTAVYTRIFGIFSIPMLAFIAFAFILLFMTFLMRNEKNKKSVSS